MGLGAYGFQPARLREAREARRQSVSQLSELTGIGKKSIYAYEAGASTPPPDVSKLLSNKLSIPHSYLTWQRKERCPVELFWRSLNSATQVARKSARVKFEWAREIIDYQSRFIEYPALDLPQWEIADPLSLTDAQIENYADELRVHWKLGDGPIANLVWLLESRGILVAMCDMDAVTLDAASAWPDNPRLPIILLSRDEDRNSAVRRRFDAAHELAHLLLHKNANRELMKAETQYYKRIESQAHRFAGSFLFPAGSFHKEVWLVKLDLLLQLKHKWRVSVGVMLKRAEHLGKIRTSTEKENLWRNMGRRGWRTDEPYDNELDWEDPRLLSEGFKTIIENGIVSKNDILIEVPLDPNDFASLCGLDSSYFNEKPPRVQIIDMSRG